MHLVLTDYDMTLLRVTCDPPLRSGMGQVQMATMLPGLQARMNPRGRLPDAVPLPKASTAWTEALRETLSPSGADRTLLDTGGRHCVLHGGAIHAARGRCIWTPSRGRPASRTRPRASSTATYRPPTTRRTQACWRRC